MKLRKALFVLQLILTLALVRESYGQVSIPGNYFHQLDKFDTSELVLFKSIKYDSTTSKLKFTKPYTKLSFNSSYPRGYNDGPIWKGRGLTWEVHAGFQGKKGKFSYTFMPSFFYSQNASFELAARDPRVENPNNYQFFRGEIDWTQRYGSSGFASSNFGQSEIKLDLGSVNFSVSTQNYSLGPSVFNPILLSRQAEGIPHLRVSLQPMHFPTKKLDIGKLGVDFLIGSMRESEYFDSFQANDRRYFNGLFISYSPNFMRELTLSFNRTLYKQTRFFEIEDLFSVFYIADDGILDGDTLSSNDAWDQIASVTLDWNFPEVGFRAYAEFAKQDFTGPLRWTLSEPDHGRAYTIGFEKLVDLSASRQLSFGYEHTNLSRSSTVIYRSESSIYTHAPNTQGYTINGQIVGAGIGPGGNSDNLDVRLKSEKKWFGLLLQRIEIDRDYFIINIQGIDLHQQEYSLGFHFSNRINSIRWTFESTYSYTLNRYYLRDESNLFLGLSLEFDM